MTQKEPSPLISVVIVNYKVPDEIAQLVRSLQQAELYDRAEVIVVDNASEDDSQSILTQEFPELKWISLKNNIGFGKACNVGSQRSRGEYILFINPDTLVSKNTLQVSFDFMESHQEVGILGPKIIKHDGTFQIQCRRSFPTPLSGFSYLFGLNKLFPKSKALGKYFYTHINPDVSMEVDAISGSYMFVRQELFNKMGGFDKDFFMYGEDLDLCARCKELGYKVWYNPTTQIVHFKGKSSTKNLLKTRLAFYESMIIFSKKYKHSYGTFFPGWLLTLGIFIQATLNIGTIFLKSSTALFIDFFTINFVTWAVITLRFLLVTPENFYVVADKFMMIGMHLFISIAFITTYAYRGVYSSERYSAKNTFFAGLVASTIFLSGVYFIKSMALSRIAFGISALLISIVLVGWRELLPRILTNVKQQIYTTGRVLVLGNDTIASILIKNIEADKTAQIYGVIWPTEDDKTIPAVFQGYPVIGRIQDLRKILDQKQIDLLLVATTQSWYSAVIEALTFLHLKHLTIRWVPLMLFNLPSEKLPTSIPLNDFSI